MQIASPKIVFCSLVVSGHLLAGTSPTPQRPSGAVGPARAEAASFAPSLPTLPFGCPHSPALRPCSPCWDLLTAPGAASLCGSRASSVSCWGSDYTEQLLGHL